MIELRLRTRITDEELDQKWGKIVTEDDYNLLVTARARVLKPDGTPLCVYLPGALSQELMAGSYPALHHLKGMKTDNRGPASGSERTTRVDPVSGVEEKRSRGLKVSSGIVGAWDAGGAKRFCRLTSWTHAHPEKFAQLMPLLQRMGSLFEQYERRRYDRQIAQVLLTNPFWVIEGTPFTTVTVNNSYPTGVHLDKGDLDQGFSVLAVPKMQGYTESSGVLVFPRYRVAVRAREGDVVLMDAHEHHGNTRLYETGPVASERISVVAYFRTNMVFCGSPEEEAAKAQQYQGKRAR